MIALYTAFTENTKPAWLDLVILCTLQLLVGTNVSVLPILDGLMNLYYR